MEDTKMRQVSICRGHWTLIMCGTAVAAIAALFLYGLDVFGLSRQDHRAERRWMNAANQRAAERTSVQRRAGRLDIGSGRGVVAHPPRLLGPG
jgi:hypothetical protein